MSNHEAKLKVWDIIYPTIQHISHLCEIELRGIDNDDPYFHPIFKLEDAEIRTQCDVSNNHMYAARFYCDDMCVDLSHEQIPNIVAGYVANREKVLFALTTMSKIKSQINTLHGLAHDYFQTVIVGESHKELSEQIINELRVAPLS